MQREQNKIRTVSPDDTLAANCGAENYDRITKCLFILFPFYYYILKLHVIIK